MQRGQRLGFEVLRTADAGAANPVMLDVLPHPLIWVQLWRIAGQKEQAQSTPGSSGELPDSLGAVYGVAIQDQKHRTGGVMEQPTAEVDEHLAIQVAVVGGKPQLALGRHGRDQVDPEPIARGDHHRGAADRRPGGPGMVVRAHPGLIGEVDRRPTLAACSRIAGYSSAFHRATASGFCWEARYSGRWGDRPSLRSSRPTLTSDSATPNARGVNSRIIARVHSANANRSCRGSLLTTSVYSRASWEPLSLGGRPGTGRALSASRPPSRYLASQEYTAARVIPSAAATSSGWAPCSTWPTARIRSCSRVL